MNLKEYKPYVLLSFLNLITFPYLALKMLKIIFSDQTRIFQEII